jgi:hypothetical protein
MNLKTVIVVGSLIAAAANCQAQTTYNQQYWFAEPHHSSTVAEGYFRGQAAYLQAYSQWQIQQAQAAYWMQLAERQALENRNYRTRCVRSANQATKIPRRQIPPAPKPACRPLATRPAGLASDDFTAAGEIAWPETLLCDDYQASRDIVAGYLAARTTRQPGADTAADVQRAVREMVEQLAERQRQHQVSADDFLQAWKLLRRIRGQIELDRKSEQPQRSAPTRLI